MSNPEYSRQRNMNHVLVTGATGFIGGHLVRRLREQAIDTTCLVRSSSNRSGLDVYEPRYVVGDLADRDAMARALDGVDVVFHLAGATKALHRSTLQRANADGTRLLASCGAAMDRPPIFVLVSSLAAAGPACDDRPLTEEDASSPVSAYGRSKRDGEIAALEFAGDLPVSIVRPPIVLGEGDQDGFVMFRSIHRWGVHVAPGGETKVSVVHADDLVQALQSVADRGTRAPAPNGEQQDQRGEGIYYAAATEIPTYGDLGRMIGRALGRPSIRVVHSPMPLVWLGAGISELASRIIRKPNIMNLDKAREASAGSWMCTAEKLRRETGFVPERTLQERLNQTAQWYIDQRWIKS